MTKSEFIAVRVKNHPARLTVYNLHRPECRSAKSGDGRVVGLDEYAIGTQITRATVPPETGWVFGKGSSGGDPGAPVWITEEELRFTCGHCLRGFGAQEQSVEVKVELLRDESDVAVVGEPGVVKSFLTEHGLWVSSQSLGLDRIRGMLGKTADVSETAAEIQKQSARWLKLTPESAERLKRTGLVETDKSGIAHAMFGKRGSIEGWVQVESGPRSLLKNPAVLSGVAGIMSQAANQQALKEITSYLETINKNVEVVLRKLDDSQRAKLRNAASLLDEAIDLQELQGRVDDVTWDVVSGLQTPIGEVHEYALDQLRKVVQELDTKRVPELADVVQRQAGEARDWLVVVAFCLKQRRSFYELKFNRVLQQEASHLDNHRKAMVKSMEALLTAVTEVTDRLLAGLDLAAHNANARMVWHLADARTVVDGCKSLGTSVNELRSLLGIEASQRNWELRELRTAPNYGSRAVQGTKDHGKKVAATLAATAVVKQIGPHVKSAPRLAKEVIALLPKK